MPETKTTFTITHNGETWTKQVRSSLIDAFMRGQGLSTPEDVGMFSLNSIVGIGLQNEKAEEAAALLGG